MHDAIRSMLDRYECRSRDDYVNALREILQDVALPGNSMRSFAGSGRRA